MKKKVTAGAVLLLLLFLLCFPTEALSASQKGLKLWLEFSFIQRELQKLYIR